MQIIRQPRCDRMCLPPSLWTDPTWCVLSSVLCVIPMLLLDRVKMAAGSISEDEFNDLAMKLVEFSTTCNDTWTVKNSPVSSGSGCMLL